MFQSISATTVRSWSAQGAPKTTMTGSHHMGLSPMTNWHKSFLQVIILLQTLHQRARSLLWNMRRVGMSWFHYSHSPRPSVRSSYQCFSDTSSTSCSCWIVLWMFPTRASRWSVIYWHCVSNCCSDFVTEPPRSVLRPYRSAVYITRIQWAYETRNSVDIHSDTAPFDFRTV